MHAVYSHSNLDYSQYPLPHLACPSLNRLKLSSAVERVFGHFLASLAGSCRSGRRREVRSLAFVIIGCLGLAFLQSLLESGLLVYWLLLFLLRFFWGCLRCSGLLLSFFLLFLLVLARLFGVHGLVSLWLFNFFGRSFLLLSGVCNSHLGHDALKFSVF